MSHFSATQTISSSAERVFDTVAHIENFSKAVPSIKKVEMLSEIERGVGTRFRETRVMDDRENTVELEGTEYLANERVRIVSEAGGAIWDSIFTISAISETKTELSLEMDARPKNLAAKLVVKLIKGKVASAIEQDMIAVKAYCESQ